jgi:predicted permease
MRTLVRECRYAWRTLRASPGFVITTLVTIGVGVGLNTAVFATVYSALLRPLPYAGASRIVIAAPLAPGVFLDWQRQATSFSAMAAFRAASFDTMNGDRASRVDGAIVTAHLFDALGVRPAIGRMFTDQEAETGARVAVLSDEWRRQRFGTRAQAIGARLLLDGEMFTIVGVMPPRVDFPIGARVWVPPRHVVPEHPLRPYEDPTEVRSAIYLGAVARMGPGATVESAEAERRAIFDRIRARYPREVIAEDLQTPLVGVRTWLVGDTGAAIRLLMIAVSLVLCAAFANVAGLVVARSARRRHEFAIRKALGARTADLVRQVLVESSLLGLASALVGLLTARLAVPRLVALFPGDLTGMRPALDVPVLSYGIAVSWIAGLAAGSAAAVLLTRTRHIGNVMNAPRTETTPHGRRTARALISAEFAVSFVLVVGAVLFGTSLARLTAVNPGFDARGVEAIEIQLPATRYPDPERQRRFFDDLLERVRAAPGVGAAAATARVPFSGADSTRAITIDGSAAGRAWSGIRVVSRDYFRVLGVRIERGRPLTDRDRPESLPVAVVNAAMARTYWPNQNPIGKRFRVGDDGPWLAVVGLAADTRYSSLREPAEPEFYVSYRQTPWSFMTLVISTRLPDRAITALVGDASARIDAAIAIPPARPLSTLIRGSLADDRFQAFSMIAFALTGVLIATVGLFGVTSYIVTQRTREIGIRTALGASPRTLRREVVSDALRPIVIGLVMGAALAAGAERLLQHRLFDTHATTPWAFVLATVTLTATALTASLFPAVRASRVDPVVALRSEQ